MTVVREYTYIHSYFSPAVPNCCSDILFSVKVQTLPAHSPCVCICFITLLLVDVYPASVSLLLDWQPICCLTLFAIACSLPLCSGFHCHKAHGAVGHIHVCCCKLLVTAMLYLVILSAFGFALLTATSCAVSNSLVKCFPRKKDLRRLLFTTKVRQGLSRVHSVWFPLQTW